MGKYVNETSNGVLGPSYRDKCFGLLEDGATAILQDGGPSKFGENLVCVVDNGMFAAAGYCYDEREFESFKSPSDDRPKRWFIYPKVLDFVDK